MKRIPSWKEPTQLLPKNWEANWIAQHPAKPQSPRGIAINVIPDEFHVWWDRHCRNSPKWQERQRLSLTEPVRAGRRPYVVYWVNGIERMAIGRLRSMTRLPDAPAAPYEVEAETLQTEIARRYPDAVTTVMGQLDSPLCDYFAGEATAGDSARALGIRKSLFLYLTHTTPDAVRLRDALRDERHYSRIRWQGLQTDPIPLPPTTTWAARGNPHARKTTRGETVQGFRHRIRNVLRWRKTSPMQPVTDGARTVSCACRSRATGARACPYGMTIS